MGEFSKMTTSRFIVSLCGFCCCVERPKMAKFSLDANVCVPPAIDTSHSFVWLATILLFLFVADVLSVGTTSQIESSIIETISIAVIYLAIRFVHDDTVHIY